MAKTQAQLSLGISSHNNHYLFSDHYLNAILKTDARWTAVQPEAAAFMAWVTALYRQEEAQFPGYSESQLEDHWFKPIFDRLGHVYEGQAKIPGLSSGVKYPDFVFFPDETARQQTTAQIITLETELNRQVYALFHLTPAEIEIIETSTKYKYGEV